MHIIYKVNNTHYIPRNSHFEPAKLASNQETQAWLDNMLQRNKPSWLDKILKKGE